MLPPSRNPLLRILVLGMFSLCPCYQTGLAGGQSGFLWEEITAHTSAYDHLAAAAFCRRAAFRRFGAHGVIQSSANSGNAIPGRAAHDLQHILDGRLADHPTPLRC